MSSLCDFMTTDTTVITPNQRLAQTLIQQWMSQQKTNVVAHPKCYPLASWLRQLYTQIIQKADDLSAPVLIEDSLVHRIWEQLIDKPEHRANEALAENLYQTWAMCQTYCCTIDPTLFNYNHQTKWFAQLAIQFEKRLANENLITQAQLIPFIQKHLEILPQQNLVFVCFDQLTPQQQLFIKQLTKAGGIIAEQEVPYQPCQHLGKMILTDAQTEMHTWINWLVEQKNAGKDSLAVILPDLQDCAKDVQRQLRYHFHPDQFNLSMGQSLLDYPLISQAMMLLRTGQSMLSNHEMHMLLTSPYVKGGQSESLKRAFILENDRLLKQAAVNKQDFLSRIEKGCPVLFDLYNQLTDYPEKAYPSVWSQHFYQRLIHFGFPGEYGLNSEAYQCYEKWQSLLTQYGTFDRVEQAISFDSAIGLLENLLRKQIFQPQSSPAPIQILGILEASGCQFDAIWMAGMTDLNFPATGNLNPFIPIPIQKQLSMPYACQAKELNIAKKILNRMMSSCHRFTASYARLSADKPNMPSSLIRQLPIIEQPLKKPPKTNEHSLQTYSDPDFVPIQADENLQGGSRILANQAQCPFKAFAAHRLAIQDSEKAIDGLDARDKGNLIHVILQTIWQQLHHYHNLISLPIDALRTLINQTIDQCINQLFTFSNESFEQSLLDLEKKKLSKLIESVLEEEKNRPPFEVTAVEQSCEYEINGFSLRLKYDRLDTVEEDGSKWIIDYKSSLPSGTPWLDDRPDDAQLLLYALMDNDIKTISYMQIKTGDVRHKGFAMHPPPVSGITAAKKMRWEAYRSKWKDIIQGLAEEFLRGDILPSPKKNSTCVNCPYGQLCRYPLQNKQESV